MEDKLREEIKVILENSRGEDWVQDFEDSSADERRVETFNNEYAIDELIKLFREKLNAQKSMHLTALRRWRWLWVSVCVHIVTGLVLLFSVFGGS